MARADDEGPPWFKRLGIDRTCRLVAMCRGMVTLTRTINDWQLSEKTHTLWLFDQPLQTGSAVEMRRAFAAYLIGNDAWLYKFYA